jgi:hypothetical protein
LICVGFRIADGIVHRYIIHGEEEEGHISCKVAFVPLSGVLAVNEWISQGSVDKSQAEESLYHGRFSPRKGLKYKGLNDNCSGGR